MFGILEMIISFYKYFYKGNIKSNSCKKGSIKVRSKEYHGGNPRNFYYSFSIEISVKFALLQKISIRANLLRK